MHGAQGLAEPEGVANETGDRGTPKSNAPATTRHARQGTGGWRRQPAAAGAEAGAGDGWETDGRRMGDGGPSACTALSGASQYCTEAGVRACVRACARVCALKRESNQVGLRLC